MKRSDKETSGAVSAGSTGGSHASPDAGSAAVPPTGKKRRWPLVLLAIAGIIAVAAAIFAGVVSWRLSLAEAGVASIGDPTPIENVRDAADADGRVSATATYSSVVAEEGHEAQASFTWDDDWFFADPTEYNHELARASIVFSAVANSESAHYQADSGVPDYMESLLAQLGFENVSTASYEYRSEVIDQLAAVFQPNATNVTAYTIASKHITDSTTGKKKLLVMVAVRGSYGTEWLSNLQMGISTGVMEGLTVGAGDHSGFSEASLDLVASIQDYLKSLQQTDPDAGLDNVSLLLCGHSRGAATVNLAAAYFDHLGESVRDIENEYGDGNEELASSLSESYIHPESIYCYGFATPGVTDNSDCRGGAYANIFNILNPADIVPRMPLASWGYDRYGRDLWLPEYGGEGFDEKFSAVREAFLENVGCGTKSDPSDVQDVDKIVADIGEIAPTLADFQTPLGVVRSLGAVVSGHDIVRIIHSHAPDLYIAWVSTIGESDLRATR